MRCFGGYRYHSETRITTATRPMRTPRFLRILVALALHHAPDGGAVERQAHLVGHLQRHRRVVEPRDRAVNPAGGHDLVAALDGREQPLALLLLPLLRTDE